MLSQSLRPTGAYEQKEKAACIFLMQHIQGVIAVLIFKQLSLASKLSTICSTSPARRAESCSWGAGGGGGLKGAAQTLREGSLSSQAGMCVHTECRLFDHVHPPENALRHQPVCRHHSLSAPLSPFNTLGVCQRIKAVNMR